MMGYLKFWVLSVSFCWSFRSCCEGLSAWRSFRVWIPATKGSGEKGVGVYGVWIGRYEPSAKRGNPPPMVGPKRVKSGVMGGIWFNRNAVDC